MRSKIIFLCLLAIVWFSVQAQNDKLRIAVFDPTSSGTGIDEGTRMAVREIISSAFVNSGKYNIVERSLLERVMSEQAFSISGAVDDSQASEIGRLAGANKIVLSVITLAGGRNMLSIKLVDVNTASVEGQRTQVIMAEELLSIVEPLTLELMGEEADGGRQIRIADTQQPVQQVAPQTNRQTTTASPDEKLVYDSGNVFLNGKRLSINDVEQRLSVNPEALRYYQAGQAKIKTGNTVLIAGTASIGIGVICMILASGKEHEGYYDAYDYHDGYNFDRHYYTYKSYFQEPEFIAGISLVGVGLTVDIIGFSIKKSAKKFINAAVDTYNSNSYTSSIDFNFGLTQNGVGLVMKF